MTAATATPARTTCKNHETSDVFAEFGIVHADLDTFARIEADAELNGLFDTRVAVTDYVRIALEIAAEDAELHA